MKKMFETMEYNKILEMLKNHATSEKARLKVLEMHPYSTVAEVNRHMTETTEGRRIIEHSGTPPLSNMDELEKSLDVLGKGSFLLPEQLGSIAQFLTACRRLKAYLKKAERVSETVAIYGKSMHELSELEDEINRTIRGSQVDDKASPLLADLRRKMENVGLQINSKLNSLLKNSSAWFSESFVALRNGHYTLPVKREFKNHVNGTVIDISQSGSTYFIEPAAIVKMQAENSMLHIEEDNEVRRILYELTALVEDNLTYMKINIEAMEILDFIFAKAKLSIAMKAIPASVTTDRMIIIKSGRHPLLKTDSAVPLDFRIGEDVKGVIITGPNTGGKTVALKTVGLLSLMAQSGLHVPAGEALFTLNDFVLCDIGDGQSITENLSTFSSHITNIIEILKLADNRSLVLLDELGSGTDPAEGMGLAVAILEELSIKQCLFIATTHYPEIKEFAASTPGLVNARMAFDSQSLQPLFKLEIGEAGESCALLIAKRLGLPKRLIDRAHMAAYNRGPSIGTISLSKDSYPGINHLENNATSTEAKTICWNKTTDQQIKKTEAEIPEKLPHAKSFNIGDSVIVYPQKEIGIVYMKVNEKGELGVQIKRKKQLINHKRLKLHVPADKLYPDNYDFSVIFDSVTDRKARHSMGKKHDPEIMIIK
jgi:Mismatch repair ATPase (MutS family)